jgi:IS30 family transposase
MVVCDPRRNALSQEGNQNDRVAVRKLAELLHNNQQRPRKTLGFETPASKLQASVASTI